MKIRLEIVAVIVTALAILMGLNMAWAQQPTLGTGTVIDVASASCANSYGSYAAGATCYSATVHGCTNAVDLGFIYGEVTVSSSKGTIVFFNGGAGDQGPGGTDFANDYVKAGYQVVQVVWNGPWENSGDLIDFPSSIEAYSIKDAGCRPATVLNYVYQSIYTQGGMCAQGSSAGSAAVGYALAEYGAGSYLDNVELLSGPVLSDIEKGCEANPPTITVCPKSQTYCQTGGEGGWSDSAEYIGGDATSIDNWSGINTCANNPTTAQDTAWKQMSIVDGLSDSTFTYSQTGMSGWLCSDKGNTNCGGTGQPVCQNNSAAEGQYFYVNVTADPLNVYRVDQCNGQEGVENGIIPALDNEGGFNAIEADMTLNCTPHH